VQDNKNKLAELQSRITQMPLVLEKPHRTFEKEGDLSGTGVKNTRMRVSRVFLFNDLVIRCRTLVTDAKYEFEESMYLNSADLLKTSDGFELKRADDTWKFIVKDPKELNDWFDQFTQTVNEWQIQEKCDAALQKVNSKGKLQILSATYGELSDTRYCIDITNTLKQLVEASGGTKLYIKGGVPKSKLPGFIDPSKGKGWSVVNTFKRPKKQLTVVWISCAGKHNTRTFDDNEEISLS